MTPDAIRKILQLGEGPGVEFKVNIVPNIIGKEVCALLNSAGGYVVCGVSDKGSVQGIDARHGDPAGLEHKLYDGITPKTFIALEMMELDGKSIIVIEVPAGKDLPYAYQNKIYIREGGKTRLADVNTVRDMVMRSEIEPERWERRFSLAEQETEVDFIEVKHTVSDAQKVQRNFFRDSENHQSILEELSVSRYGRLTNGGDVLFAYQPTRRLPQCRVRAFSYSSDKTSDTYHDMKSFEGPLFRVFEQAYSFIIRNTPTVARFTQNSTQRQDSPLYPAFAVREALINAFAHRDYSSHSGGVSINIYPTRLEVWNSGGLPEGITPDSLAQGHLSILRNPDIAHVLYLRGMMEKAGRGSAQIIKSCKDAQLPCPEWTSDPKLGVTLTLFAPEATPEATPEVLRLLLSMQGNMSRREIQDKLALKDPDHFREAYINPALKTGLIEMTIPDNPRNPKQKYRLTSLGKMTAQMPENLKKVKLV